MQFKTKSSPQDTILLIRGLANFIYRFAIITLLIVMSCYLYSIMHMLNDSRAIQSEARDSVNTITCFQLNKSVEAFQSCVNDVNAPFTIGN